MHWYYLQNGKNFDRAAGVSTGSFIAKYPGALGNSLAVSFCTASESGTSNFSTWSYKGLFDNAPTTSPWAAARGTADDEMHVVIIDRDGLISGSVGTVLESYGYVSMAKGAMTVDGSPNYIGDILNSTSGYIWNAYFGSDSAFTQTVSVIIGKFIGQTPSEVLAALLVEYPAGGETSYAALDTGWTDELSTVSLSSGTDGVDVTAAQYVTSMDLYEDAETVEIDFLIVPQISSLVNATTVINAATAIAVGRKDCVAVSSPHREGVVSTSSNGVVNQSSQVTAATDLADTLSSSSYLVMDNNFIRVFDKYNDNYIFIPAASSTAGLMAATDKVAAPWFSPAGARRGNYLGVTDVASNPSKTQRDTLYKAAINPIANIPGQGVTLFGDKTFQKRPSAFDRINVRRLFLAIERSIGRAGKNVMFEFNDEFTRAEFVNIVEPLLREIKGRRGITDFRVVCDETNNTGAVIDRNEFVASIFIKPARSINFVTLNFVAVRTGVDFEEIVGAV